MLARQNHNTNKIKLNQNTLQPKHALTNTAVV